MIAHKLERPRPLRAVLICRVPTRQFVERLNERGVLVLEEVPIRAVRTYVPPEDLDIILVNLWSMPKESVQAAKELGATHDVPVIAMFQSWSDTGWDTLSRMVARIPTEAPHTSAAPLPPASGQQLTAPPAAPPTAKDPTPMILPTTTTANGTPMLTVPATPHAPLSAPTLTAPLGAKLAANSVPAPIPSAPTTLSAPPPSSSRMSSLTPPTPPTSPPTSPTAQDLAKLASEISRLTLRVDELTEEMTRPMPSTSPPIPMSSTTASSHALSPQAPERATLPAPERATLEALFFAIDLMPEPAYGYFFQTLRTLLRIPPSPPELAALRAPRSSEFSPAHTAPSRRQEVLEAMDAMPEAPSALVASKLAPAPRKLGPKAAKLAPASKQTRVAQGSSVIDPAELRARRVALGWTHDTLHERANVSKSSLARFERTGLARASTVVKLVKTIEKAERAGR